MVAALGLDGAHAPLVIPGPLDAAAFETYVTDVLAPQLRPGDVVIWDRVPTHHCRAAAAAVHRAGARLMSLSPYSPDYTPIEKLWSKVKAYLRRVAARSKDTLYVALGEALETVTPQDIIGWFEHAGLCATRGNRLSVCSSTRPLASAMESRRVLFDALSRVLLVLASPVTASAYSMAAKNDGSHRHGRTKMADVRGTVGTKRSRSGRGESCFR